MAVLVIFRWQGDPDQLLAGYDREFRDPPPSAIEQPTRSLHACARTEDGMVIVDVWDSEADFRAMMADPAFQQNLREADYPDPDSLEVWPIHASIP
jgi:hypothetical protein